MDKEAKVHLGIRVEPDVMASLKEKADVYEGSVSLLVRNILRTWLKKNNKKSV